MKLPENMTEVGEDIFGDCKNLRGVKIPEGVSKNIAIFTKVGYNIGYMM